MRQKPNWWAIFYGWLFTALAGVAAHGAELPPELQAVKQQVIAITAANTNRTDNIAEVRAELEPLIAQLAEWFNDNRPANEVELTQVPWKNLWYDDPDIAFDFNLFVISLKQNREQIYQVIEEEYYYNVSEIDITILGMKTTLQSYLKGNYVLINPPTEENVGQPALNVVDLEFDDNSVRRGTIPQRIGLSTLVKGIDSGVIPSLPVPGPRGVTGELWNVFVDHDLRIATGFDDSEPETLDLYILRKVQRAE